MWYYFFGPEGLASSCNHDDNCCASIPSGANSNLLNYWIVLYDVFKLDHIGKFNMLNGSLDKTLKDSHWSRDVDYLDSILQKDPIVCLSMKKSEKW